VANRHTIRTRRSASGCEITRRWSRFWGCGRERAGMEARAHTTNRHISTEGTKPALLDRKGEILPHRKCCFPVGPRAPVGRGTSHGHMVSVSASEKWWGRLQFTNQLALQLARQKRCQLLIFFVRGVPVCSPGKKNSDSTPFHFPLHVGLKVTGTSANTLYLFVPTMVLL